MSMYVKSKTTVSNLNTVENAVVDTNSIRVGIKAGAENLIINYLTNLYSNPSTAVVRELFTNACDTSSKDSAVDISIEADGFDGSSFKFTIIDHGSGMDRKGLEENYIQYASSTKTNDYSNVGSFGLGSKSPMAIVPEYKVVSSDGNTTNECVVQRIEEGIFANIEQIATNEESFTKVEFDKVPRANARRMANYIYKMLIPFSGRKIKFTCDSTLVEDAQEVKYESVKLPKRKGYKFTIFAKKNLGRNIFSIFNGGKRFCAIARVNNTPYVINDGYHSKFLNFDEADCYLVIDVEPGYFAFAPSREQLPDGDALNRIKELCSESFFNSFDEMIEFITKRKLVDNDWLFTQFVYKNYANKIEDYSSLRNHTQDEKDKIKDTFSFFNGGYEFAENDQVDVVIYTTDRSYGGKFRAEVNDSLSMNELYNYANKARNIHNNSHNKDNIINIWNNVRVLNNTRYSKRKQEPIIPSYLRVTSISGEIDCKANELCKALNSKFRGYNKSYDIKNTTLGEYNEICIFVPEGVQLSEKTLNMLSYVNLSFDGELINFAYPEVTEVEYDRKSSNPRKTVPKFDERKYDVAKYCFTYSDTMEVGSFTCNEIIAKYGNGDYCFISDPKYISNAERTTKIIKLATNRSVIVIRSSSKKVWEALESHNIPNINPKAINDYEYKMADLIANTNICDGFMCDTRGSMNFKADSVVPYIIKNHPDVALKSYAKKYRSTRYYTGDKTADFLDENISYFKNKFDNDTLWFELGHKDGKSDDYQDLIWNSFNSKKYFYDNKIAYLDNIKNAFYTSIPESLSRAVKEVDPNLFSDIKPLTDFSKVPDNVKRELKAIVEKEYHNEIEDFRHLCEGINALPCKKYSINLNNPDMNNPIDAFIVQESKREIEDYLNSLN